MQTKHVLITGGAGFIGSHLCENLLQRGYAVTAIDNLVTGRAANIQHLFKKDSFDFHQADVIEPIDFLNLKLSRAHGISGIFHFACPASPVDFDKIPFEILKVDSIGTARTVDFALKHKIKYILASTSEVYGDPLEHPQRETYYGNVNPIGIRACYDEAKRFSEAYVSTAIRAGLKANIVRIFNTYGPRMRLDDGRVIPEFFRKAMSGQPLPICGSGLQTRSFCYVTDLVAGILALYESEVRMPVNIGNPSEITMLHLAETLRKILGRNLEIQHLPPREDDPKQRRPDITRAQQLLGWSPSVSLEFGLKETFRYFSDL